MEIRSDWTLAEVRRIYALPLPELIFQAQVAHRAHHRPDEVQLCRLLSIKTGGCPEDCAYCPQSAHYNTGVARQGLLEPEAVLQAALRARDSGATRFCMGAAWRQALDGPEFDRVLEMVRSVAALKVEVCCTLGMLTEEQAVQLKQAGLTAYNHNLDTSPEFYGAIITTRVYEDRLKTIACVRKAGVTVCCGGILGMGESEEDRIALLQQLANLQPHPESVPINLLARRRNAARACSRPRRHSDGSRDRHGQDSDARFARAARGRTPVHVPGGRCTLFSRRSEFHFHGRKTSHHAESSAG